MLYCNDFTVLLQGVSDIYHKNLEKSFNPTPPEIVVGQVDSRVLIHFDSSRYKYYDTRTRLINK